MLSRHLIGNAAWTHVQILMDSTFRDKSECGAQHNRQISWPSDKDAVPELDQEQLGIVCSAEPDGPTVRTTERLEQV